jgi:hypothetical protein
MRRSPCLTAALRYLEEQGWCPLSLCGPDHVGVGAAHRAVCRGPGKGPLQRWGQWQERRPSREDLARQWQLLPGANVGVVLGPVSGLVGIDVDGPGAGG